MIMCTTYQLAADYLIHRHGEACALEMAKRFARTGVAREFWGDVTACIEHSLLKNEVCTNATVEAADVVHLGCGTKRVVAQQSVTCRVKSRV